MGLSEKTCVPCQGGMTPLNVEQAQGFILDTPGWELLEQASKIARRFTFKDFMAAMAFAQKVGQLAEQEFHHPDITFGWGYCSVVFFTHKINGLHENDFIMAAKTNQLYD